MKYLKLFEGFENTDIVDICKQYNISNYVVNTDGSIDVDNFVNLFNIGLSKLPLKFNKVNGYFNCSCNNLTTLEGSPKELNGGFFCYDNKLTSLEGSPKEVNGDFYCYNNQLTSFEFAPKIIRGDFDCRWNNIKSFEYFPSFVKGNFFCSDNPIWYVWCLFRDTTKIELLNDFDIFRDEDTNEPSIFIDGLNDFLEMIGKDKVEKVYRYKNL